jgi:hypothetical protein
VVVLVGEPVAFPLEGRVAAVVVVVVVVAEISCIDMPEALVRLCLSLVCQRKLYQQSLESSLQPEVESEL